MQGLFRTIHSKRERGFTLIELLVVIAIIAVLSSIIFMATAQSRQKARNAVRLRMVGEYVKALELYYSHNGTYPPAASLVCLGDYGASGYDNASCWAGATFEDSSLMTGLAPFIANPPSDTVGANQGFTYQAPFNGGVGNACNGPYMIDFFLEGNSQQCFGAPCFTTNSANRTRCRYKPN